jgi:hypothetical protein
VKADPLALLPEQRTALIKIGFTIDDKGHYHLPATPIIIEPVDVPAWQQGPVTGIKIHSLSKKQWLNLSDEARAESFSLRLIDRWVTQAKITAHQARWKRRRKKQYRRGKPCAQKCGRRMRIGYKNEALLICSQCMVEILRGSRTNILTTRKKMLAYQAKQKKLAAQRAAEPPTRKRRKRP